MKSHPTQHSSQLGAWVFAGLTLAAALFLWLLPDGKIWWQQHRPDLIAQRDASQARDRQRQRDLTTIQTALAAYARVHRTLPAPKEYGGNDGDDWDVSTKGDFLRFLANTLHPIPLDPINQAVNDPCNDPNSYGYGYSVTNLDTGNPLDRTYIICTQLEATHKAYERRESLRDILTANGGATPASPARSATLPQKNH